MIGLKIIQGGLFSTFQDKGRVGYRNLGVPSGGVMDIESQYIANALVSNAYDATVLEMTGFGTIFEVSLPMVIAITGATVTVYRNNDVMPMYQSIKLNAGDIVKLQGITEGLRSYVSFSNELLLEKAFKSNSTYTLSGFGGYKGRALKAGDSIEMKQKNIPSLYVYKVLKKSGPIHVMLSYEYEDFDVDQLILNDYIVSSDISRMGIKLEGHALEAKDGHGIISSPVCPGTIQVPGSGHPIILLKDGQTTGGYKRIACVIYEDLNRLGQYRPGDRIKFEIVDIKTARKLKKEFENHLNCIKENLKVIKAYDVNINQKYYYVTVEMKEN